MAYCVLHIYPVAQSESVEHPTERAVAEALKKAAETARTRRIVERVTRMRTSGNECRERNERKRMNSAPGSGRPLYLFSPGKRLAWWPSPHSLRSRCGKASLCFVRMR